MFKIKDWKFIRFLSYNFLFLLTNWRLKVGFVLLAQKYRTDSVKLSVEQVVKDELISIWIQCEFISCLFYNLWF